MGIWSLARVGIVLRLGEDLVIIRYVACASVPRARIEEIARLPGIIAHRWWIIIETATKGANSSCKRRKMVIADYASCIASCRCIVSLEIIRDVLGSTFHVPHIDLSLISREFAFA